MNHLVRIILITFFLVTQSVAGVLEIKVSRTSIYVPYWPPKKSHYGAVVLVVGGVNKRCPVLLTQSAAQLAKNGWSVIALNCTQKSSIPWVVQLPEVISQLRQMKNKRIVMIHYGEQLNQSFAYFSKPQSKMINGLVMLSAYDEQNSLGNSIRLRFPLFDIAGQFDYDTVLSQRQLRAQEFKRHNYVTLELPGAHHDYEYSQKLLLAFIHGWMTRLPESRASPRAILLSYIEPFYSSS